MNNFFFELIELTEHESFRVLRWTRSISSVEVFDSNLNEFRHLSGVGNQWHMHAEAEITLILSGVGLRVTGDNITHLDGEESLVMLGQYLPHYWMFHGASSGVSIQFAPERLCQHLPGIVAQEIRNLTEQSATGLNFDGDSLRHTGELMSSLAEDAPGNYSLRFARVLQVLGWLGSSSHQSTDSISATAFGGSIGEVGYTAIQRVLTWIFENFQKDLSIALAMDVAKMSKPTFSRQFKKSTGRTFTQYVNEVRVSYACRQLLNTDHKVSAIAHTSGFNNLSHFNRCFRTLRDVSPHEYRDLGRPAQNSPN